MTGNAKPGPWAAVRNLFKSMQGRLDALERTVGTREYRARRAIASIDTAPSGEVSVTFVDGGKAVIGSLAGNR